MESACEQWCAFWHKRMPILNWLPHYNIQRDFKFDVIAGFTVGVMLVPQEMSLAAMMGVPAQYGLYTAAVAPLIYPMFGSSKALSVANAAEGSLLVGVMLRSTDIRSAEERIATGILLTFFTGVIMIIGGLIHQGGVVSFFSRTSMQGYVTGTSFLIVISQISPWLGITLPSSKLTLFTIIDIIVSLGDTNRNSFLLGLFSVFVLYACKKCRVRLQRIAAAHTPSSAAVKHSSDSTSPRSSTADEVQDEEMDDVIEVQLHNSSDVHVRGAARSAGHHENANTVTPTPSAQAVSDKVRLMQAQDDTTASNSSSEPDGSSSFLERYLAERPTAVFWCTLFCDGGALLVCVIGMFVGAALGEDQLHLTGRVHQGLPAPVFPPAALGELIPWDRVQTLITNSMMIAVVFFMASVATGSKIAAKDGYEISPNQELLGLGFANLGASFFQGMPSSAGMSRSAVNAQSAHTPLASMITALLVVLTILFLTGPLYYLPQAPLSAIIILSAITLGDFAEPKWLRRVRKHEFYVWVASFAGTLCFGLLHGLFISLLASLIEIMVRTKKPRIFIMGQLADGTFAKMETNNDEAASSSAAVELPDALIVRMEQDLYFANAGHLIHAIERDLKAAKERGRMLGAIIDGSRMNDIDATAIHMLKEYEQKMVARDQTLLFANLTVETEESIVASGFVTLQECDDETNETATRNSSHRPSHSIASAIAFLRQQ